MSDTQFDLSAIRERLRNSRGKEFWRSLDEIAETQEFQAFLAEEFPREAAAAKHTVSRRDFLKLIGAGLAMAGLAGCAQRPTEPIVPYVDQPEEIVPGKPLFFATAMSLSGFGAGVLVENHMGRPTKVEGNPLHPASLGATDSFAQGSVLQLYDPDRAETVTNEGQISTWESFLGALDVELDGITEAGGAGFRILTETVTSPTLGAQLLDVLEQYPQARWHQYEPVGFDNRRAGAQLAFGQFVNTVYTFEAAERILSLDSNFLFSLPGSVRYASEFIDGRRAWADLEEMNRLYAVESTPTITGAKADHRVALRADRIEAFARMVAQELGIGVNGDDDAPFLDEYRKWIAAMVRDLQEHAGASLVIAGEEQPPAVHALAHAMNAALDNVGNTLYYTEPVEVEPTIQIESLRELVDDMAAGDVETLLIIESNPVLTAPADLDFVAALENVGFCAHMSLYFDETSRLCDWHVPMSHYLESWSDVRAFDGTASIVQPLIEPLFQSRSPHELFAHILGEATPSAYEVVRSFWADSYGQLAEPAEDDFETFWRTALHDGVIDGTAFEPIEVSLTDELAAELGPGPDVPASEEELEIIFRPDPSIWDGRFANVAWLQELPKHLTQLTWDNAALMSPATADRLGLSSEDLVELRFRGQELPAAVWVMPGHADDSVTLHLGYGRTGTGRVSEGLGFNAYSLRTLDALWFGSGLEIREAGETYPLASTQQHDTLAGRDLVRAGTFEQFQEEPDFAQHEHDEELPSLYPEWEYEGNAWGMAIDLSACIGCNACNIACQVENSIPTVGKEGVRRGREMHWLKVDRYYSGDPGNPSAYFQPRPCMHCEKAPCEVVCPVEATVHDSEGLNQMIYNRCVGTRYCSNNCPYKVRRFNFLDYVEDEEPLYKMWRNPDVTVRSRGVMEKCTYCVQRINHARTEAKKENRPIRDGEIQTACQEACPTQAIVFGDINNEDSLVTQMKAQPLNYGLLAELGTQPRTTYLAALSNPNPEIEEA